MTDYHPPCVELFPFEVFYDEDLPGFEKYPRAWFLHKIFPEFVDEMDEEKVYTLWFQLQCYFRSPTIKCKYIPPSHPIKRLKTLAKQTSPPLDFLLEHVYA